MAISRYKYFEESWDEKTSNRRKNLISQTFKNKLRQYPYFLYEIPLEEQYRPDLISKKIYGTFKYHWILTYANNFFNSPEDFKLHKVIKIPDPSILDEI